MVDEGEAECGRLRGRLGIELAYQPTQHPV
jgi:hypothetical protein